MSEIWKTLTVIALGVFVGCVAHFAYYGAYAPSKPTAEGSSEMEWLRTELDLSEQQWAQISYLHGERENEIQALSQKVRKLELTLAELEEERVNSGYVDFLEMREYVAAKRELDEACFKSTNELIASVGELMNIDQRRRYLSIVRGQVN